MMSKIAKKDLSAIAGKLVIMETGIRGCSAPPNSIGNVTKVVAAGKRAEVMLALRYEGFNGNMGPHEHRVSLRSFMRHFRLLDAVRT